MTRHHVASAGAWVLALSGIVALWRGGTASFGSSLPPARTAPRRTEPQPATPYHAESLVAVAATQDVFRADRRPAPTAYDPSRAGAPLLPPAPRPALTLSGIVWGDVPEAVLEGIPGSDGPRVLQVGEGLAGLTVRRIEPGRVVIAGMDTTWTLTVRTPW